MRGLQDLAGHDDVAARSVASRWYIAVSIVPDSRARPNGAIGRIDVEEASIERRMRNGAPE